MILNLNCGARQVKTHTNLARQLMAQTGMTSTLFDLENPIDLARLEDPMLTLQNLEGLVVLDEIQRRPEIFAILRVLTDRSPLTCRFLVLGSASPELLQQSSETLAGQIHYHEIGGFALDEVGIEAIHKQWFRGGFPNSFLASSDVAGAEWR
jgi:predicted AAA+ superfamily ATPase